MQSTINFVSYWVQGQTHAHKYGSYEEAGHTEWLRMPAIRIIVHDKYRKFRE